MFVFDLSFMFLLRMKLIALSFIWTFHNLYLWDFCIFCTISFHLIIFESFSDQPSDYLLQIYEKESFFPNSSSVTFPQQRKISLNTISRKSIYTFRVLWENLFFFILKETLKALNHCSFNMYVQFLEEPINDVIRDSSASHLLKFNHCWYNFI